MTPVDGKVVEKFKGGETSRKEELDGDSCVRQYVTELRLATRVSGVVCFEVQVSAFTMFDCIHVLLASECLIPSKHHNRLE